MACSKKKHLAGQATSVKPTPNNNHLGRRPRLTIYVSVNARLKQCSRPTATSLYGTHVVLRPCCKVTASNGGGGVGQKDA